MKFIFDLIVFDHFDFSSRRVCSVQVYSSYKITYIFYCILQNYYVKFGLALSKDVELYKKHTHRQTFTFICIQMKYEK